MSKVITRIVKGERTQALVWIACWREACQPIAFQRRRLRFPSSLQSVYRYLSKCLSAAILRFLEVFKGIFKVLERLLALFMGLLNVTRCI